MTKKQEKAVADFRQALASMPWKDRNIIEAKLQRATERFLEVFLSEMETEDA